MLIILYDGCFFMGIKKISSAICSCRIFLLSLRWNLTTLDVAAPASSGVGVFSFILPHLLSEPHLPQTDRIDNDYELDGTESCLFFISSFLSLFTMFTMFTCSRHEHVNKMNTMNTCEHYDLDLMILLTLPTLSPTSLAISR